MKKFCITIIAKLLPLMASAVSTTINGINYGLDSSTNMAEVVQGFYSGNIIIPSQVTYGGVTYAVTSIGYNAFSDCSGLTSVTIPNSVTNIDYYAFKGCSGLTSVTIPNSVTSIGGSAFSGCSGLTSITVPSSVTSIRSGAFSDTPWFNNLPNGLVYAGKVAYKYKGDMPKNTSIIIEDGTVAIGDNAFSGCSGLTSVTIPDGVTSIGAWGFEDCSSLTSVTIPDGVTSIGRSAFSGCSGLTSVTIPNSVTSIGNYAFYGCSGLPSITIPSSVTSIGDSAFWGFRGIFNIQDIAAWCKMSVVFPLVDATPRLYVNGKKIEHLVIPSSVESIGDGAFSGFSLASVTIPNSVTSIGRNAFSWCSGLTSVTIPSSVTSIGGFAFSCCSGLTSVTIPSSVTSIGNGAFSDTLWFNNQPNGLIYAGKVAYKYKGDMLNNTSIIIEDGTVEIAGSAFSGCSGLTSVTIPNSVNSICGSAFEDCSGLTTVISEIEKPFEIASSVFEGIPSYTELTVPKGTKAAYQATEGWNKFTKITEAEDSEFYVDGIYYIMGENNTVSVTSGEVKYSGDVVIPSQVTYNGNSYTVTSINSVAFMDCTNLTSVTIPNSVKSIGSSAFWGCKGLTSVTIPNGVTSIESGVFYHCYGLTSVTIPNSVMSIGDYAFWECSITSLTIPNSVTSIGENAFGDGNLMNPIVSEIMNPFEISENTFNGINYVYSTLIVPPDTKLLYQSTAGWNKFKNIVEDNSDEANFAIDGVTYQGTKSAETVVVKSVDAGKTWLEVPASISYDGIAYQVTGIADDAFNGSNIGALVWNVEAALSNNAFSNASIGSNFLLYVKSATYAPSTVKNVVVDGTALTVALLDNGGPFSCPQTFIARSISYTHKYTMETGGNGKGWESLVLPFFVQKISHSTRGEIVPFALYSSGSSQKPFWLAKFSGNEFKRTSAIEANEPYIIAMPNSKNYRNDYNLAGEVTFSAENAAVPKTPTFDGAFVPAFAPVTKSSSVKALNNASYSSGYDPGSRFIPNLRDVHPFEAYMTGSSSRGIVEINFDDGTTDMLDVLFLTDDAQEVTIHTLSGLQMTRTTQRDFDSVWQQLPRGVYIVNGKKMIK